MSDLQIVILGPGCQNCQRLESNVRAAVAGLGYAARIEHVRDYARIASYGIMRTPGLVVNGEVVVSGRVPAADEIRRLLAPAAVR